jgi:hypothetical protein
MKILFKKQQSGVNVLRFQRKGFFLKYLQRKNLIKQEDTKQQSIDLKNLLDENNIKITYYDIFKDWKNFRNEYYYETPKFEEEPEPKKPSFDKKDMSFKNFFTDLFNNDQHFKRCMMFVLFMYVVAAYFTYRINGLEKRNMERLEFLHSGSNRVNTENKNKYDYLKH